MANTFCIPTRYPALETEKKAISDPFRPKADLIKTPKRLDKVQKVFLSSVKKKKYLLKLLFSSFSKFQHMVIKSINALYVRKYTCCKNSLNFMKLEHSKLANPGCPYSFTCTTNILISTEDVRGVWDHEIFVCSDDRLHRPCKPNQTHTRHTELDYLMFAGYSCGHCVFLIGRERSGRLQPRHKHTQCTRVPTALPRCSVAGVSDQLRAGPGLSAAALPRDKESGQLRLPG